MSVYRSCGAPIIWTETVNGKRMPVDKEPLAGTFVLISNADLLQGAGAEVPPRAIAEPVHLSQTPSRDLRRTLPQMWEASRPEGTGSVGRSPDEVEHEDGGEG